MQILAICMGRGVGGSGFADHEIEKFRYQYNDHEIVFEKHVTNIMITKVGAGNWLPV